MVLFNVRIASPDDSSSISEIYNQGIDERIATFETRLRTPGDVQKWFDGIHPIVVGEEDGTVISFASSSEYRKRECYSGVAEFSVYVDKDRRGLGYGKATLKGLMKECKVKGFWKLVSRIFVENMASRELMQSLGFREVGIYQKHGKLEGIWKDVVIVEAILDDSVTSNIR